MFYINKFESVRVVTLGWLINFWFKNSEALNLGALKKFKYKLSFQYHNFERLTFFRELSSAMCAADYIEYLKSSTWDAWVDR